jgi:pimeloyl-ACP methyl ester carboxylesterase
MILHTLLFLFATVAPPCTKGTAECTEWVSLNGGAARGLVYRTHAFAAKNEAVTRALVVVHGSGRDADNYFRTAVAAAFLAGALENTVMVAPRFASNDRRSCKDALNEREVNWSCDGDSWRSGGISLNRERLTSYDFMDEILRRLADKSAFPNLKRIVLAGHSAGGQFVTRYEMSNRVHDSLGVPLTYLVSNPSSYAYVDAARPSANGEGVRSYGDARNCTTYDNWPYGLHERTGYTAGIPDVTLKKQLSARPAVYLLGELDTLPLGGFDSSCPAMAQGPTRLARGQAFARYVNEKYGGRHKVVLVPLCGHNARCMFTSEAALPLLFPKQ